MVGHPQVQLFKHQQNALDKFKNKEEIALFFEMGCGKSLTSTIIACHKFKEHKISSLLIVAPNDVHKQWYDDLTNSESVLSKAIADQGITIECQIFGGKKGQKQLWEFDNNGKLHIVCCNIDTFSTAHKWEQVVNWANQHRTMLILDEATSIKNPTSMRSQRMLYGFNRVVRRGKTIVSSTKISPIRCVLTGTPVTNGPMDLWSIMEFIKPNYFGMNYYTFMNYYGMHTKMNLDSRTIQVLLTEKTWQGIKACADYGTAYNIFGCSEDTYMTIKHQDKYLGPYKHADELKRLLEPNAVFAKLVDCVDMPSCNYIVKQVSLSKEQEQCYNSMKKDLIAIYKGKTMTAKNKLIVSLRLQQIASGFIMCHTDMTDEDFIKMFEGGEDAYDLNPEEVVWLGDTNPKLEQMMRDIDELDKPIIIMTRFTAEAAKIYDLLKDKYSTCLATGWKMVGSIDDFKEGKYDIMVCNIAKIARGFNLQNAHVTIYYSNTFSMELRQQSEFRTFRMGQQYPCTYIDYASCDIDKIIVKALQTKKGLLNYIREKDNPFIGEENV